MRGATSRGQSSTSQDAEVTGVSDYLRRLSETVPDMVYAVYILSFTCNTHTHKGFSQMTNRHCELTPICVVLKILEPREYRTTVTSGNDLNNRPGIISVQYKKLYKFADLCPINVWVSGGRCFRQSCRSCTSGRASLP